MNVDLLLNVNLRMHIRRCVSVLTASFLLLLPTGSAQLGIHDPSNSQTSDAGRQVLERIADSVRRYARDVTEIRLNVQSTTLKYSNDGKSKASHSVHVMQFVKRSFASGRVIRELNIHKGGLHRVTTDEVNPDSATSVLALAFESGKIADTYTVTKHVISNRLELKIIDRSQCQGFDPKQILQRRWCGEMHLFVDATTFQPLSMSFDAGGFPLTIRNDRYLSYGFVEEFQTVSTEGSGEPLLLPSKVIVSYETSDSRTVVENKYSLAPQKKLPPGKYSQPN